MKIAKKNEEGKEKARKGRELKNEGKRKRIEIKKKERRKHDCCHQFGPEKS